MRILLISLMFLIASVSLQSQDKTIEIPVSKSSSGYDIYPVDTSGFFLVERVGQLKSRERVKQVYHYDKNFETKNVFTLYLDERYGEVSWVSDANGVYFLYQKKQLQNELVIMHVKLNGEYELHEIPLFQTMDIKHFHVADNSILIGGVFDFMPIFFLYNIDSKRLVAMERVYKRNTSLIQSRIDTKKGILSILTGTFNGGQNYFEVKNFDLRGNLLRKSVLSPPNGEILKSSVISDFIGDDLFVFGSYSAQSLRSHTGVYVAQLLPTNEQKYTFTPYFKIPEFFNHYSEKRANRLIEKAENKLEKKGKWATSRYLEFYPPQIGHNKTYLAALKDIGADNNIYQMAFNENSELLSVSVTPYQHQPANNLLNQLNKNGLAIGLQWVYNDDFYFVSQWNGKLTIRRMDSDGVDCYEEKIPLVFENRAFGLYNGGLNYWYENRILTSGRIYEKGSTQGKFVVTSWTLKVD